MTPPIPPTALPPDRGHLLTEQRNPASEHLDSLDTQGLLELMNQQDASVPAVVAKAIPAITPLVDALALRMSQGGRLIYLGAGTSGRLGVLDASECPPTFNADPNMVHAIIAGGDDALRTSSEGMEDDPTGSYDELKKLVLTEKDTIVGIAASGTTPYVHGGLHWAHGRQCMTALICCVPQEEKPAYIDHLIELPVGPEVITGSSRLKAGTATKLALNMITTSVMVKLGKTWGNLMVDVRATNSKLRDRAIRIIGLATGLDRPAAAEALDAAQGRAKIAIVMLTQKLSREKAMAYLDENLGRISPNGLENR